MCCEALRDRGLHIGGINLHCYRLGYHVHGKNEAVQIFFADQNSFDAYERSPFDSNPLAALQEGMRFYLKWTLNGRSDRLNLSFRNDRNILTVEQNHVNPG